MNKTAQTEFRRLFLIESLPEPLTPASKHIQLFDNYIENTRVRLRRIRDPYSKTWTRILQQRFAESAEQPGVLQLAEIYLNDDEYAAFERFEGREIRKNRYFQEAEGVSLAFDIYLGGLWGLNTARVDFETREQMREFVPPEFAAFEITSEPFFMGENLVGKNFANVKDEVERIASQSRSN